MRSNCCLFELLTMKLRPRSLDIATEFLATKESASGMESFSWFGFISALNTSRPKSRSSLFSACCEGFCYLIFYMNIDLFVSGNSCLGESRSLLVTVLTRFSLLSLPLIEAALLNKLISSDVSIIKSISCLELDCMRALNISCIVSEVFCKDSSRTSLTTIPF